MNHNDEMEKYSGEQFYKRPPKLSVGRIKFDGNNGSFGFLVKVKKEKEEVWEVEPIGKSVKAIVIRVRRRLSDWNSGMSSTEHNVKIDKVALFKDGKIFDKGTGEEMREKYNDLRVTQVLYLYLKGKVYTLDIKGASLGSDNKAPDTVSFYDYLRLFNANGHIWQYYTTIESVPEKKGSKSYYAMNFKKGEEVVDEEVLTAITAEAKKLHETFLAQEGFQAGRNSGGNTDAQNTDSDNRPSLDEIPVINLEDDEIKPEDIPF